MKFLIRGMLILLTALPATVFGQEWSTYRSEYYGFSMLMPEGAMFAESEGSGGWAELYAEHDGVKLFALTKRGEQASAEEIEAVGVRLTGIPSDYWTVINEGERANGWIWWATVEAASGDRLVVGDYGIGPSGSYLLLLETTGTDYQAHKADYKDWYQSIRLF